jgi:hypothetical protein
MKHFYIFLVALLTSGFGFGQTTTIDFETVGDGYTPSTTFGSGNTDIFNRTGTAVNGNSTFHWAAEDISGNPTITLDPIDVTGSTSFTFAVDLSYDNASQWDSTDELLITYSLDGGAYQNLMWVQSILDGDNFNAPAGIDLGFDGDGDSGQELSTSTFITFTTAAIPLSTNTTLDIEFQFNNLTSNGEGIFIDNIVITEVGGGGPIGPSITNIVQTPIASAVTTSDAVSVSADVTDADGVFGVELNWGTTSGSLTNTITMSNSTGDTYITDSSIPAQMAGTTIFYEIYALDNNSDDTTSPEQSYTVITPPPSNDDCANA